MLLFDFIIIMVILLVPHLVCDIFIALLKIAVNADLFLASKKNK